MQFSSFVELQTCTGQQSVDLRYPAVKFLKGRTFENTPSPVRPRLMKTPVAGLALPQGGEG